MSNQTFAQLEVKSGSFKEVKGFVNINPDPNYQTDDNDLPFAVIKVRTENISDKQRRELRFEGNSGTFIILEYKTGEVWVYLTAKYADYLKISHPELSSTEFALPYDLQPQKGYEMTLINKTEKAKVGFGSLKITTKPENGATVKLNGKEMSQKTPFINEMIPAGEYDVEISKYGFKKVSRHIVIQEETKEEIVLEMPYAVGGLRIVSVPDGANVFVDNVKRGKTPVFINDLRIGKHTVRVEKVDFKTDTRNFSVEEDKTATMSFDLKPLTDISELLISYVQNGYKFFTVDLMSNQYGDLSYGLSLGYLKEYGFFVSTASNFCRALNADLECDNDFYVDGFYPDYTGECHYSSLSVVGGFMAKVSGPVAMKVGVGYGQRIKAYETRSGHWVKHPEYSATGVDVSVGLQCNLRGFVLTLDCVSTNFKIYEAKIGLGYGIKNK